MQRTMETRLNALPERTHTYVSIRVPTRRTGREECTRSSIHTLAWRSGHFGRNPGCGTPLSYSSSCLEPVYARQVSSRRPLNRPFQVLRACSARACMCEWNTGLEGASLPPPMSQNGTERERFACSFPSLSFSPRFLLFHFHFRFKWSLIGSVICRIDSSRARVEGGKCWSMMKMKRRDRCHLKREGWWSIDERERKRSKKLHQSLCIENNYWKRLFVIFIGRICMDGRYGLVSLYKRNRIRRNKRKDSWQQLSVIIKKPVAALECERKIFFL